MKELEAGLKEISMTPRDIFEKLLKPGLKEAGEEVLQIAGVFQFKLTGPDGGTWSVDTRVAGAEVLEQMHENPGCVFTIRDKNFVKLAQGKLSAERAVFTGRIRVSGNLNLARKFKYVLDRAN